MANKTPDAVDRDQADSVGKQRGRAYAAIREADAERARETDLLSFSIWKEAYKKRPARG